MRPAPSAQAASAPPTLDARTAASLPDEEIVRRVLAGERRLFEIIVRRYNQRLYRIARSVIKDETEAEDVLQQAYLSAYVHLAQFAGQAKLSTWLIRIALNEALMRVRRGRGRPHVDSLGEEEERVLVSPDETPEEQAMLGELSGVLEKAIDQLPEHYRITFMMRQVEGLSTLETADALGISEEAVKLRLFRARGVLRTAIERRLEQASERLFPFHASRCDRIAAAVLAGIDALTC